MFIGNIPWLNNWLLAGFWLQMIFWLSYFHYYFLSPFSIFYRNFFFFCLEKIFWFDSPLSSRFFAYFDVSFHDLIATRREIIYGHTWGLGQQKCFFERSHCKLRREIGQIENQIPKREKNPRKIRKKRKSIILRRSLEDSLIAVRSQPLRSGRFPLVVKAKKCAFQAKRKRTW